MDTHSLRSSALLLASFAVACSSSDDSTDVRTLRVADQVEGWAEVEGSYAEFDASTLYNFINGGAQPHVDHGLVEGFVQDLESDTGHDLQVYVEKFDGNTGAQSMFDLQTATLGETLALESAPASTALAGRILGGAAVYAHWGRFYFAMTLTGYAASEDAAAAANVFLSYYAGLISP